MSPSPPSLNRFVIFNPTIKPPLIPIASPDERDRDLEDDLAQAAQILFYTSREAGGVSRDKMLRQVGLVKGLMAFSQMVAPGEDPGFWSVHSHRARMVVFTPEDDFHIYANITLSHQVIEGKEKAEPVASAQGVSDNMLVAIMRRGYEDFKLLHGPLTQLLPPSSSVSAILDKFWTRFAFSFESAVLTPHPDPSGLEIWLGGFPVVDPGFSEAANMAIELFKEDAELEADLTGAMSGDGPMSTPPTDGALTRYLVGLLRASLPHEPIRSMEVEHRDDRKSSWTGWVPTIPGLPGSRATPTKDVSERKERKRWPGLGLGGLGETIGSVGGVFSYGNKPEKQISTSRPASIASERDLQAPILDSAVHPQVLQSTVILPDLEAAQAEPELELKWERREVWYEQEGVEKRCLQWIIRDNILLYLVDRIASPNPTTTTTLSLFSRLSALATSTEKPALANSAIHSDGSSLMVSGPPIDPASGLTLRELKDVLEIDTTISEVYARTPSSKFVAAKRTGKEELYMLVGRKDASLVDADHAVQAYERRE